MVFTDILSVLQAQTLLKILNRIKIDCVTAPSSLSSHHLHKYSRNLSHNSTIMFPVPAQKPTQFPSNWSKRIGWWNVDGWIGRKCRPRFQNEYFLSVNYNWEYPLTVKKLYYFSEWEVEWWNFFHNFFPQTQSPTPLRSLRWSAG